MMEEGIGNYINGWKRSFDFSSRSRRFEFWFFMSGNFFILFLLSIVEWRLFRDFYATAGFFLVSFVPAAAVTVRRLHDIGRSGLWALIVALPIAGIIALLYLMLLEGQLGTNRWGISPKRGATGHWR